MHQINNFNRIDLPSSNLKVTFDSMGSLGVGLSEITMQYALVIWVVPYDPMKPM